MKENGTEKADRKGLPPSKILTPNKLRSHGTRQEAPSTVQHPGTTAAIAGRDADQPYPADAAEGEDGRAPRQVPRVPATTQPAPIAELREASAGPRQGQRRRRRRAAVHRAETGAHYQDGTGTEENEVRTRAKR